MGIPYGYVLLVGTIVLAIRHIRSGYASNLSKRLVGGLAAVSVLALYMGPGFLALVALVLQLAVCLYVIFQQAARGPDEDHAKASRTVYQDGDRPTRLE
jgi:hypothetical protein